MAESEPEPEAEPEPEPEAEPEPEPTGLIVHVLLVRVQARNARLVRFLRRPEVQKLWDRSSFQAFASVKADTVQSARLEQKAPGEWGARVGSGARVAARSILQKS